jgi:aminoglycoside 6'-N-acetyltransferase
VTDAPGRKRITVVVADSRHRLDFGPTRRFVGLRAGRGVHGGTASATISFGIRAAAPSPVRSHPNGGAVTKNLHAKRFRILLRTVPTLRSAPGPLLRAAEVGDAPLLARWRSDPRILEFYGGRDKPLDEAAVRSYYFGRRRDPGTGRFQEYRPCIAETERGPVAFVQFYRLPRHETRLFGVSSGERTHGIDLFIADPRLWGKGLGTRLIGLTRDYLCEARGAVRVMADPRVENLRSVRALEKAGFRKIRILPSREIHEGIPSDCWLMEYP